MEKVIWPMLTQGVVITMQLGCTYRYEYMKALLWTKWAASNLLAHEDLKLWRMFIIEIYKPSYLM